MTGAEGMPILRESGATGLASDPVERKNFIRIIGKKKSIMDGPMSDKLQINCFGRFSIRLGCRELDINWRTKKAEELIAYLVCRNGRFISKEKIAETLWPGLDSNRSIQNLYGALYFIRKQFPGEAALPIQSERGKMRICMDDIDCDMVSFERLAADCLHIHQGNIGQAEYAVSLYKGTLLEENYYEWAAQDQVYYDSLFVELCEKLAQYHQLAGNLNKAQLYRVRIG